MTYFQDRPPGASWAVWMVCLCSLTFLLLCRDDSPVSLFPSYKGLPVPFVGEACNLPRKKGVVGLSYPEWE